MSQSFPKWVHPSDQADTIAEYQKLLAGAETLHFIIRYQSRQNAYLLFEWMAKPDWENQLIYCMVKNITEQNEVIKERNQQELLFRTLVEHAQLELPSV